MRGVIRLAKSRYSRLIVHGRGLAVGIKQHPIILAVHDIQVCMVLEVDGDSLRCETAGGGYRRCAVRGEVGLHEHICGGITVGAQQSSRVERHLSLDIIYIIY